jgi:biopolymer transport protein ExbD
MNLRRPPVEAPEINLVAFIDVLLVILIFLVLTTTYARWTELPVSLPTADAQANAERPTLLSVGVSADGAYTVQGRVVNGRTVADLQRALRAEMSANGEGRGRSDDGAEARTVLVIAADAQASHQSVVRVLDAARAVGLARVTIAAQRELGVATPGTDR